MLQTIILVPVAVIGSVLLVGSCLFFKRSRKNKRNASSSVADKNKSGEANGEGNSATLSHGITNTAFSGENGDTNMRNKSEANTYDYATNEQCKKMTLGHRPNASTQPPGVSPVYDDVEDSTSSRFYFTLERNATSEVTEGYAGNKGTNDGSYVIAIHEDLYEKPVDAIAGGLKSGGKSAGGKNSETNVYHTLEEFSDQDGNSQDPNMVNEENSYSADNIYETCENEMPGEVSIDVEAHDSSDDDTYVISIPNEVHGMKNENIMETQDEHMYVVNIPIDMKDSKRDMGVRGDKYEGYPRHTGMKGDKVDGYSNYMEIEEDIHNGYPGQSGIYEDKGARVEEGIYDQDEIYENVNVHLHSSQEDINDEDILSQNETQESDEDSDYVIPASENVGENTTNDESGCYDDDDIYENWEENIVGRLEIAAEDEDIYSNDNFHVSEENQDPSFYENLANTRKSLVARLQHVR